MIVRLGYVSVPQTVSEISSFNTINFTNYCKTKDINSVKNIALKNLNKLEKIIDYNIKNNIHFYRITSDLIPLATHKEVIFNYTNNFKERYESISKKINQSKMRVDMHPSEYTVLNSTKKQVIDNTFDILKYHYNILKMLKIKKPLLILHIGSNEFGKEKSISRFINNFNKLPLEIKKTIAIENDDKTFNIIDTLMLCEKLNCPMVLDYHHHKCNNNNIDINIYLKRIFNTWQNQTPKIHFSSPKNSQKKDYRSHHEYIDCNSFIELLNILKPYINKIDIMLEAKMKDVALFKLTRELKYKTNFKFIDETSFIV